MVDIISNRLIMDYSEPCQYSTRLIKKLESLDTEKALDFDLIHKAIYWAKKYHDRQFRKSGEPYYTHPLEVAYMVSEYKLTTNVIVTAILHDIVEDTEVTAGMILDEFGRRIEQMVDRLTRDRPDGTKLSVEQILDNAYEKNDKEVLLIKVVDRLHNMQTLGAKTNEKQKKTINDTLENILVFYEYLELPLIANYIVQICTKNKINLSIQNSMHNIFSFSNAYSLLYPIDQNDEH